MLTLVLAIVAAVIAGFVLIQTRGANLIAWAVLILAIIHIIPAV
jgi:hypothetical protein